MEKLTREWKAQWCEPGEDPDRIVDVYVYTGNEPPRIEHRPLWELRYERIQTSMERDDTFRVCGR